MRAVNTVLKRVPLVLLVILVSGCALGLSRTEPPYVTLSGMDVVRADLFEQRFLLRLRMQNPNGFPLPISGMKYALEINNRAFARGVTRKPVTIPAYGEEIVDVEVVSDIGRVIEQFQSLGAGDVRKLNYRLSGSASLANRMMSLPFEYKGEIDLAWPRPGTPR
ncbi:MAG: LEA type 2 family protein [bacterium]